MIDGGFSPRWEDESKGQRWTFHGTHATSTPRRERCCREMINIRKLAALDMVLHGVRLIATEYALGVAFPLLLAFFTLRSILSGPVRLDWQMVFGVWLVGIAVNYIPLLIYAILIARAGSANAEGRPELAQVRRYNVQQLMLLIPFLVAVIALVQELSKPRS